MEEAKHRILRAQEGGFLRVEEASMGRILLAQEVGFLFEEASIRSIDQISSQQFHSPEQTVDVGSDLEGLAVSLQDARFRQHLDRCRNKVVWKISQGCMAGVLAPFHLGVARDSLGESLEGEWLAEGAGLAEVEGDSHPFQDFKVWVVMSVSAITQGFFQRW